MSRRFLFVVSLSVLSLATFAVRRAGSNARAQMTDELPGGGVVIFAPEPYAWRVWPRGKIEFSFDSSHTWQQQKSGVSTDLTAGSAPTRKVCWVVGKSGTILLTTDQGRHWQKNPSPTGDDLEGVHAEDARRASIWTASRRHSFATNDGSASWAPNEAK